MMIWISLLVAAMAGLFLLPPQWLELLKIPVLQRPDLKLRVRPIFFMALIYAALSAKLMPFAVVLAIVGIGVSGMEAFKKYMSNDPLGVGDLGEEPDPAARAKAKSSASMAGGKMPETEALAVLGISEHPVDKAMIEAAYKKLILQIHPDKGGSTYLAAKINEARDVLLDQYRS